MLKATFWLQPFGFPDINPAVLFSLDQLKWKAAAPNILEAGNKWHSTFCLQMISVIEQSYIIWLINYYLLK